MSIWADRKLKELEQRIEALENVLRETPVPVDYIPLGSKPPEKVDKRTREWKQSRR